MSYHQVSADQPGRPIPPTGCGPWHRSAERTVVSRVCSCCQMESEFQKRILEELRSGKRKIYSARYKKARTTTDINPDHLTLETHRDGHLTVSELRDCP